MKLIAILAAFIAASEAISFGVLDQSLGRTPDRVIKTGPLNFEVVSEATKLEYRRQGKRFIDVTESVSVQDAYEKGMISGVGENNILTVFSKQVETLKKPIPSYNYPTNTTQKSIVGPLLEEIDIERVKSNLAKFTSFYTRYYKSSTGFDSANWLYDTINEILSILPSKAYTVQKVKHNGWDQYSIVVSLVGEKKEKVIVGAHQDSINLLFPNLLGAPGADDDGSGTVTTLEALRLVAGAIAKGDFTPHNTLEFHYYSAEEGGLLGSIDVFNKYYAENVTVVGMLQQDMTGYTAGTVDQGVEPHFGLITDYTSTGLNDFIKLVIGAYCGISYHETKCGYACSDHASALENGYPSSFLIESEFKYTAKQIHLTMDTMDRLDFEHVKEHIKLTVGYAVELSAAHKL